MNKSSRLLWFLVLAQSCAVVFAIGLRIVHQSELRSDPPLQAIVAGPDDANNQSSPPAGSPSMVEHDRFFTMTPVLTIIPLACGICTVAKRFSPKTRDFFDRNHTAYFVWLMISLIALLMFLSALAPEVGS